MSKIIVAFALVAAVLFADAINPLNEGRVGNPHLTNLLGMTKPGDTPNYGSYVTTCDQVNQAVIFHNYAQQNCAGSFTNFTKPLNKCYPELLIFSWNGFCNSTNMWYNNFGNTNCAGNSVLTRMYTVGDCFNCPNPECKNP